MLVVQTFTGDNIRLNLYAFIGWGKIFQLFTTFFLFSCWHWSILGGPAVFVLFWSIVKIFTTDDESEKPKKLDLECSWMRESLADWIIQAPACTVLIINLIFLIKIMWVSTLFQIITIWGFENTSFTKTSGSNHKTPFSKYGWNAAIPQSFQSVTSPYPTSWHNLFDCYRWAQ